MNPMLQMINSTPQAPATQTPAVDNLGQIVEQAKPLYNMFRNAQNPVELMKQMCMQNPAIKQAYETANMMAGNDVNAAKEAFYKQAKQMGIDPDAFLAQLTR